MRILIDLDGTLTDSFSGITRSIQHALIALGRSPPPAESLRWCLGPPLKKIFASLLGLEGDSLADVAVARYRERYSSVGLLENRVYPGVEAALAELQKSGHTLHVATSKPSVFAERIVRHFELRKYFHSVDGSELDGTRSDKTSLVAHILMREGISAENALMIGDREHDMTGARQNGVRGVGVLWGYGSREELEAAGAYTCISSPGELPEAVRKMPNKLLEGTTATSGTKHT